MKPSHQEYKRLYEKHSPPTKSWRNIPLSFLVGGAICALGQLLKTVFLDIGLPESGASAAVSVSLIFLGVFLTAVRLYSRLAKYAGAGTLVPITGFANAIAAPALEFKTEGFVLGTCVKMFSIAGPVIVFGVSSSVLYGIILYFFG